VEEEEEVKVVSIQQALQHVADYPEPVDDIVLNMPVHECIARALFDIANRPDQSDKGSMTRANTARKLIFDRLGGKRRAGTKPISGNVEEIEFFDLTGGGQIGDGSTPDGVQPVD
jgi:hypothetical protein